MKTKWKLIGWSVEEIQIILTQKWLEQKIIDQLCNQNVVCGIKKSRFVKEQEAKGLLNNLGIKTPLSKIQVLNVLF